MILPPAVGEGARRAEGAEERGQPPVALSVRRLRLRQFRCYEALRLDLLPAPVVVTGPNGAGKTALIEALSFLSPGRGLRRARLDEVTRFGQDEPWALAASLDGKRGEVEIGTGLQRAEPLSEKAADETLGGAAPVPRARRLVRIDGKAAGPGDLAEEVALLWLTPPMDRLFQEGAAGRRRFLDRLVLALVPAHARHAGAYDKAMRERNRLLREPGQADRRWLDALEERMAETGVAMAAARLETLSEIETAFAAAPPTAAFPRALLALEGGIAETVGMRGEDGARERFQGLLAEGRSKDRAAGQTLTGPHRADLRVTRADSGLAAELCSTGEQKALLIAILFAEAKALAAARGVRPLLLLDEVAAHLDAFARAALCAALAAQGGQAWLTGSERSLFEAMPAGTQFLTVQDGEVRGGDMDQGLAGRPSLAGRPGLAGRIVRNHE